PSLLFPPRSPNFVPCHCPEIAISTGPGGPSASSQHVTAVSPSVVGILFLDHQVAVLRLAPPSTAETICHGGTCKREGFELNCTPLDRVSLVTVLLTDFSPSPSTTSRISGGPPLLTI